MHPSLLGHPIDFSKCGGLALQRAGHTSPVRAGINHDGLEATAEIEWLSQGLSLLDVLDSNRITEEGAEAVALTYVNATAGWVVKRRLQRGESADWLLHNEAGWLALEVSDEEVEAVYRRAAPEPERPMAVTPEEMIIAARTGRAVINYMSSKQSEFASKSEQVLAVAGEPFYDRRGRLIAGTGAGCIGAVLHLRRSA